MKTGVLFCEISQSHTRQIFFVTGNMTAGSYTSDDLETLCQSFFQATTPIFGHAHYSNVQIATRFRDGVGSRDYQWPGIRKLRFYQWTILS